MLSTENSSKRGMLMVERCRLKNFEPSLRRLIEIHIAKYAGQVRCNTKLHLESRWGENMQDWMGTDRGHQVLDKVLRGASDR